MTKSEPNTRPWGRYTALFLTALLLSRIAVLLLSPVGLHGDEAQYWSWAQDLDFGYFSKPPLIAWVIWTTTAIFGDAEWAVRISSPIIHTVTATILYLTGKYVWDSRTGFWGALTYILMPGVSLSSGIVSTDVSLLLCWAIALYAGLRLRDEAKWKWTILMGVAIGVGCLSKYAMFFFLPALAIAIFIDAPTRKALLSVKGLTLAIISGLILLPNILWNAANDFATVTHTAANANISGIPFHPLELLQFWGDQVAVFGPITLVFYVIATIYAVRGRFGPHGRWLALFVLSPLLIISLEALLSRANANWAVTTYVAGALLTGRFFAGMTTRRWLVNLAIAVNVGLGAFVMIGAISPKFVDAAGQANAFKRLRGWPETRDAIKDFADLGHEGQTYSAIAFDSRMHFYDMNYYGLGETAPLKMWLYSPTAHNHAEATMPLPASSGPILLVNHYADFADEFETDFGRIVDLGEIKIELGGGKVRTLRLWAGYNYTPTQGRD